MARPEWSQNLRRVAKGLVRLTVPPRQTTRSDWSRGLVICKSAAERISQNDSQKNEKITKSTLLVFFYLMNMIEVGG